MKKQRVAYFDCYSGISGDMILGALFDLGVESSKVRKALLTLDLKGYKLKSSRVKRGLIAGTKAQVSLDKTKHLHVSARKYSDIKKMIANSDLSLKSKKHSQEIFKRIAQVEAAVHKTTMEKIVEVHYPDIRKNLIQEALEVFFEVREIPGLKKKPSTSELIDWLKLLMADDIPDEILKSRDPNNAIPPLYGALLKNEQDVHMLQRLAFMARRERPSS